MTVPVWSWKELLLALSALTALYYLAFVFIYYRRAIFRKGERAGAITENGDGYPKRVYPDQMAPPETDVAPEDPGRQPPHSSSTPSSSSSERPVAKSERLYAQVLELMESCKPVYEAAAEHFLDKAQVIDALKDRLKACPEVRGSKFQSMLSEHIASELQGRVGMELEALDIDTLWDFSIPPRPVEREKRSGMD